MSALQRLRSWCAQDAIVLGSGLGALVEEIGPEQHIAYSEFPELPQAKVAGHASRFVLGIIADRRVIFAQGRSHLYEGHSAEAVTGGIRLLAQCGVRRVVLTNAAGSANPEFQPGNWMLIADQLNLTGTSPLLGAGNFIDMSNVYSEERRNCFLRVAREQRIELHHGVYAGVLGPQYETPAEVRMLRGLGADAIGMSTVLEAIQARALGLEVSGFSCLTNWAAGIGDDQLSHSEVLSTGKAAAAEFSHLLAAAFSED